MSYAVNVLPAARQTLRSLPFEVQEHVLDQLEILLENPVERGERGLHRVSNAQRFRCALFHWDGLIYHCVLGFHFRDTVDENELSVFKIAVEVDD
jgi:hypothetical protein